MSTLRWGYFTEADLKERQNITGTGQKEDRMGFEVQLGAFSGPLDLLCHLVEAREMDPTEISLTELVSQYVQFLLNSRRTTLNEMAEFFAFASRLLLRKVHSLFPAQAGDEIQEEMTEEDYVESDEELRRMLEVFRPYRNAAAYLSRLQMERERCFVRIADEESSPFYDIGDLYSLAAKWWELLDRYNERNSASGRSEDTIWEDIPDAVPEERQVEQRMDELLRQIKGKRLALGELLHERNSKTLIVTLLALLEMSRLGWVHILQSETLGDVIIAAA
ncbi:MAG: segregation/condensation protein A [Synergistaceae bacterium]|nr:segregation/condensation protein A [Synergistaceae bacterium]